MRSKAYRAISGDILVCEDKRDYFDYVKPTEEELVPFFEITWAKYWLKINKEKEQRCKKENK